MLFNVPDYLVGPVFYITIFVLTFFTYYEYSKSDSCKKLLTQHSWIPMFLLVIVVSLFLGYRSANGRYFGDSFTYGWDYYRITEEDAPMTLSGEWFFHLLMWNCKKTGISIQWFFFIVEMLYIGNYYWACKRLLWENTWIAMLFVLSAFCFYGFGVNGLRNGLACSILILTITFYLKKQYLWAVVLVLFAKGSHNASVLPILAMAFAIVLCKNMKYPLWIWLLSIPISLISGNFFLEHFSNLSSTGLESASRLRDYAQGTDYSKFSHAGFRWDFLLFSAAPVWVIYYVTIRRKIQDKTFNYISTVYLLANAVWILMIRMPFTNRVAYLSWFIYPFILSYAFIRIPMWKNQDKIAGTVLLASSAFTFFMFLIGS